MTTKELEMRRRKVAEWITDQGIAVLEKGLDPLGAVVIVLTAKGYLCEVWKGTSHEGLRVAKVAADDTYHKKVFGIDQSKNRLEFRRRAEKERKEFERTHPFVCTAYGRECRRFKSERGLKQHTARSHA